jgi:tRNA pseudouridine38-40 synthase
MRTLKVTVAYDGSAYVGFQRQTNGVSIQQRLEEAFAPLVGDPSGRGPTVAGAGRTDAGTHALGQVVSVILDTTIAASAVQRALNVRLPADIRVVDVVDASPGFHARYHSTGKTYRYHIATAPVLSPFERWFVWHAPASRDVDAMRRAAAILTGRHDFASFQARGASVPHTVRTLHRLDVAEAGGQIVVEAQGDGFLRHMVRTIVGTLDEVGQGHRTVESVQAVVTARDRATAGPTAPACGLTLVCVHY